ncbi:hypothetical protein VNI00_016151 [Paramarasmius palmivorus]|uniref:Uncharacterized protein n=1 Tax=Paramarasmius palmivorus TaxID=297713 RepID=A0AAW0BH16_9AGAR
MSSLTPALQDIQYPSAHNSEIPPHNPPSTQWRILEGCEENGEIIWIRAEDLIAPVPKMLLLINSTAMEMINNVSGLAGEEGSKAMPMHWPSIRSAELQIFLGWLIMHKEPTTFEGFWALLKVAHLLQVTTAYPICIKGFKALKLDPFQQLSISYKWPIWHWARGDLRYIIIHIPLHKITLEQALAIGFTTYTIIVRAKATIMDFRLRAVAVAPELDSIGPTHHCTVDQHKACRNSWHKLWTRDVREKLLHPDFPIEFDSHAILEFVGGCHAYGDLNPGCKEAWISAVRQGGKLDIADRVVTSAIDAIFDSYRRQHMDRLDWEQFDHV